MVNISPSESSRQAEAVEAMDMAIDLVAESLDDLNNQMKDVTTAFTITTKKQPRGLRTIRYHERSNLYSFEYYVRRSFLELVEAMIKLVGWKLRAKTLRYIGNIGAGKSSNLAALASYMRLCQQKGWLFSDIVVVYISDCENFCIDEEGSLRDALIAAYPAEKDLIKSCSTWEQLVEFISSKPRYSMLFIFDGWDYVCPEPHRPDYEKQRRLSDRDLLLEISAYHFRIEAIDAGCNILTENDSIDAKTPNYGRLCMYGGLSDEEWAVWRSRSHPEFYSRLRESDIDIISDFTYRVPLYLCELEWMSGNKKEVGNWSTVMELIGVCKRYNNMMNYNRWTLLRISVRDLQGNCDGNSDKKEQVARHMALALVEIPQALVEGFYLRWYFYNSDGCIRPVSGFVRSLMFELILNSSFRNDFTNCLTTEWLNTAMNCSGNMNKPWIREFAFQLYTIVDIIKHPSKYMEGIPAGTKCEVGFISAHWKGYFDRNDEGLKLFVMRDFTYDSITAVARYVPQIGCKSIQIFAFQISLYEPTQYRAAIDFFRSPKKAANRVLVPKTTTRGRGNLADNTTGYTGGLTVANNDTEDKEELKRKKRKREDQINATVLREAEAKSLIPPPRTISYRKFERSHEEAERSLVWVRYTATNATASASATATTTATASATSTATADDTIPLPEPDNSSGDKYVTFRQYVRHVMH